MEVKAAQVRTSLSTYRPHRLEILVDRFPKRDEIIFKTRRFGDITLFFGEKSGYVSFATHDPSNERGYAGAEFHFNVGTIEEPKIKTVKGPWSSNPQFMMKIFPYQVVEVSLTEDPATFERGYTFYAAHVTLDIAIQAMEFLPEWNLVKDTLFPRVESYKKALEREGLDPASWEIGRKDCPTLEPGETVTREDGLCLDSRHRVRVS